MAVGQNQWYHFGVVAPPILVYFSWDWDVHWGYDKAFDPWPNGPNYARRSSKKNGSDKKRSVALNRKRQPRTCRKVAPRSASPQLNARWKATNAVFLLPCATNTKTHTATWWLSKQGSLHYTPEHCLVDGGFPLRWWKKPCFKWARCIF